MNNQKDASGTDVALFFIGAILLYFVFSWIGARNNEKDNASDRPQVTCEEDARGRVCYEQ